MNIRFAPHAMWEIEKRNISKDAAIDTVRSTHKECPGDRGRIVCQKTYFDTTLQKNMLLRVIVEEKDGIILIITAYKTSKLEKYGGTIS